jgi:integrase
VCTTAWSEPAHPDTVSSLMANLISTHNQPDGHDAPASLPPDAWLHDLRHIHATTLLLAGVPVHVVAARLGHADPSITLRVYAYVSTSSLPRRPISSPGPSSHPALLADPLAKAPAGRVEGP